MAGPLPCGLNRTPRRGSLLTPPRREGPGFQRSTLLYFDGKPRDFEDFGCSGTQSSRRVDSRTVEILRKCASGEWTRWVRRLTAQPGALMLDITEHHPDGRRFERRLVLEKQADRK